MNDAVLVGQGWRVRFVRHADRYGHVIEVEDGHAFRPVLESIEGSADEAWPPSPPLQDLHIEQRPGGVQVALLVGRAGSSHWSLSIELDLATQSILFDAACRTSDNPQQLGSSYVMLNEESVRMEPLEGVDTIREVGDRQQIVVAATTGIVGNIRTYRWRYCLMRRQLVVSRVAN